MTLFLFFLFFSIKKERKIVNGSILFIFLASDRYVNCGISLCVLLCNALQHVRVGGFYFAFLARKHNRKFRKHAQVGQNLGVDVSEGTDISDGPAGCSLFYLNLMDFG